MGAAGGEAGHLAPDAPLCQGRDHRQPPAVWCLHVAAVVCIFEWDGGDVRHLEEAKQSILGPTSRELARHCRRRTRGAEETERLIQELLDTMWDATDNMGDIWSTQRRHLRCIQDPPGVELYTKKGELTKGGVVLPVYRCARGSTSLESFHLHLCRFIPGECVCVCVSE